MTTIRSVEFLSSYSGSGKEQVIMHLICDTYADLVSFTSNRYEPIQGSDAHIVSNQLDYEMMSDGTWVVKQTADVQSLVSLVSQLQSDVNSVAADVSGKVLPSLERTVKMNARNMVLMNSVDGSSAGVTYVRTSDGHVTTSGTATASSLWTVCTITLAADMELFLNGCPSGGDYYNGYSLFIAKNVSGAATLAHEEGDGILFTVPETAEYRVRIVARNGTNMNNLTFSPQIIPYEFLAFGNSYTPPAPENSYLYDLIRGYHP